MGHVLVILENMMLITNVVSIIENKISIAKSSEAPAIALLAG